MFTPFVAMFMESPLFWMMARHQSAGTAKLACGSCGFLKSLGGRFGS
jgi:hypothetical protein